jgi:trehalose utilization protein
MINVTIFNEFIHERNMVEAKEVHPNGIHNTIKDFLIKDEEISVRTATLLDPECGLSDEVLNNTDVLLWWGHAGHGDIPDETVAKICERVYKGMGYIPLHSSHFAKPFIKLMGTSCTLKWRPVDFERLWTVMPSHPIVEGVPEYIELEEEEMYGEFFDIPAPDELILAGWFEGGEIFRSGCAWSRGYGKVFYFQPGHETNLAYHNKDIQRIIINAVKWAAPTKRLAEVSCTRVVPSIEEIRKSK